METRSDSERRTWPGGTVEYLDRREDDGVAPRIRGLAAVYYDGTEATQFELWEGAVERIMPGAFADALRGQGDVRALFNHDPNLVLGSTAAGTLKLSDDPRGLRYEIDPPDTQPARDLVQSIQRGDVKGSSFAFRVLDQQWKTEDGIDIRLIERVELFDVGPVTFPAYEATEAQLRAARTSHHSWLAAERAASSNGCSQCARLREQVAELRTRLLRAEIRARMATIERQLDHSGA